VDETRFAKAVTVVSARAAVKESQKKAPREMVSVTSALASLLLDVQWGSVAPAVLLLGLALPRDAGE
jgi:hypothetical protein